MNPLDKHPRVDTWGDLGKLIGLDIVLSLAARVSALAACVAIVAGVLADAPAWVRVLCVTAGTGGLLLLLVAGLSRWSMSAKWQSLGWVFVVCSALLTLAWFLPA
jgi:hypothetical protein